MATIEQRLTALEQRTDPLSELPMIIDDTCTDTELERLQSTGRKVYRASDENLIEEFI